MLAIEFGHERAEVLSGGPHAELRDIARQQYQGAGVAVDRFHEVCDLLRGRAAVVRRWRPAVLLHHFADQFDGIRAVGAVDSVANV